MEKCLHCKRTPDEQPEKPSDKLCPRCGIPWPVEPSSLQIFETIPEYPDEG